MVSRAYQGHYIPQMDKAVIRDPSTSLVLLDLSTNQLGGQQQRVALARVKVWLSRCALHLFLTLML